MFTRYRARQNFTSRRAISPVPGEAFGPQEVLGKDFVEVSEWRLEQEE